MRSMVSWKRKAERDLEKTYGGRGSQGNWKKKETSVTEGEDGSSSNKDRLHGDKNNNISSGLAEAVE